MSVNVPPNPNVSTFNNSYWIHMDTALTTADADLRYLKWNIAQGDETLQGISVNGNANFYSQTNFNDVATGSLTSLAVQPLANDSTTKIPTTAWVQTAVSAGAIPSWNDTLTISATANQNINLNSYDINSVNNINLVTINGLAPSGSPNINQVLAVGQNANNQPITDLNGIAITGGTSLYYNALSFVGSAGAITDLATINGVAYPPIGSQDLNSVLSTGNNAFTQSITGVNDISLYSINGTPYPPYPFAPYGLTDTLNYSNNASGLSMTNINNIDLSTINGAPYPPSISSQDLQTTLGYGNSAGSYNINMNSQNIESANDVGLVSINGVAYLPAKFSYVFQTFNVGTLTSGTTSLYGGTSSPTIPVGTYQITYSIQLDGNVIQSGGQYYSVKGYCWVQGATVGQVFPFKVNQGFLGGTLMSYNSGYNTCITITDIIQISTADSFQLGAYQENELTLPCNTTYISAILESI